MSLKLSKNKFLFDLSNPRAIKAFKSGNCLEVHKILGAHVLPDQNGVYFTVWAPHAKNVFVVGDFNNWQKGKNPLIKRNDHSGIWHDVVAQAQKGEKYQYHIFSKENPEGVLKIDPVGFWFSPASEKTSVIWQDDYSWNDAAWLKMRKKKDFHKEPMSIYELHLGSWRKRTDGSFFNYCEIAHILIPYLKELQFTHVEFLPVMEHPFYGSWGYQCLGYFAPTCRYGNPSDLKFLIDKLHEADIGVILDWVPGHFPSDVHGLVSFDGTNLFERKGRHPEWSSLEFYVERFQVAEFLISSARYWIEEFHADGLRVDAVASMLYLDYARKAHEWYPNFYGGKENLSAVAFVRKLNETVKVHNPDILMIAEESSAWPKVTATSGEGGLGFDLKWNMGWMHDILKYFSREPGIRHQFNHELEFCIDYNFHEKFILSFSHDEVVYGKGSMLNKMPGNKDEKFESLKCLYGLMFAFPGKKLIFMGDELAASDEWNHESQLDWELLNNGKNKGVFEWFKDLNGLYRKEKALFKTDFQKKNFKWIKPCNSCPEILAFERTIRGESILAIVNVGKKRYSEVKLPVLGTCSYKEILNSRCQQYGNKSIIKTINIKSRKKMGVHNGWEISLLVEALSVLFLKKYD